MALLFTGGYQGNVFINSNEMDTDAADTLLATFKFTTTRVPGQSLTLRPVTNITVQQRETR